MKILVTGNLGYIGTILTPMLEERGHEVEGLDSGLFRDCAIFEAATPPTRMMDVRDVAAEHLEGFDAVLHLAGLSNDPLGDMNPGLTHEINHHASVRLAKLAKKAGVRRMIFASTTAVYGFEPDGQVTEASPIAPQRPYSASKAAAERALLAMNDARFTVTALRAATVYGASPIIRFDLVLNNMTAWVRATGRVTMKSTGEAWRPLVHVEDVASAYLSAVEAPAERVGGQAFNIGDSDENYQVLRIAEIVASLKDGAGVDLAEDAFVDKVSYRANCDKIRKAMVYVPKWRLIDGARQLYDVFETIGVSTDQFEGSRFKRSLHLEKLIAAGAVDTAFRWKEGAEGERVAPAGSIAPVS